MPSSSFPFSLRGPSGFWHCVWDILWTPILPLYPPPSVLSVLSLSLSGSHFMGSNTWKLSSPFTVLRDVQQASSLLGHSLHAPPWTLGTPLTWPSTISVLRHLIRSSDLTVGHSLVFLHTFPFDLYVMAVRLLPVFLTRPHKVAPLCH